MIIDTILARCDERWSSHQCGNCPSCSYGPFCRGSCEHCLDAIHNPRHAPQGAPERKYDCAHMADFYTCKYSFRYTSEIIYALKRMKYLMTLDHFKVLSFGCGPCTDLFAIDYLHEKGKISYDSLEYRGIDYSRDVWENIHRDIKHFENDSRHIYFYYQNACDVIHDIADGTWTPNLIVFQYVFSDMYKHTGDEKLSEFINVFAQYFNNTVQAKAYILLNDVNLGTAYGGGREYFDQLSAKLSNVSVRKGRFCNDNAFGYYDRGYPYGDNSDGEFPHNANCFDFAHYGKYSPFNTCASAQMLIYKRG